MDIHVHRYFIFSKNCYFRCSAGPARPRTKLQAFLYFNNYMEKFKSVIANIVCNLFHSSFSIASTVLTQKLLYQCMRNYCFSENDTGIIYIAGIKIQPITQDKSENFKKSLLGQMMTFYTFIVTIPQQSHDSPLLLLSFKFIW